MSIFLGEILVVGKRDLFNEGAGTVFGCWGLGLFDEKVVVVGHKTVSYHLKTWFNVKEAFLHITFAGGVLVSL